MSFLGPDLNKAELSETRRCKRLVSIVHLRVHAKGEVEVRRWSFHGLGMSLGLVCAVFGSPWDCHEPPGSLMGIIGNSSTQS